MTWSGGGSGAGSGGRSLVFEVVDDVDLARLELAMDGVDLERVEPERLEHVVQLRLQQRAAFLRRIDELPQILAQGEDVRLGGRHSGRVLAESARFKPWYPRVHSCARK